MPKLRTLPPRVQSLPHRRPIVHQGSWRAGQNSTQRGYGYRWQKARAAYLDAHPLCRMCEDDGRVEPATVVDHIVPHQGDKRLFWDQTNWQALCATHHSGAKARQEAEAGHR